MAEFLIYNQESSEGSFDTGDVINIKDDGFQWGIREVPPIFRAISVPGASRTDYLYLLNPMTEVIDEETTVTLKLRAARINLEIDTDQCTEEEFQSLIIEK